MKIKAFHTVLIVALLAVLITATYQLNRPERGQDPQSEPVQNMSWQPPAWVLPSASGQTFRYPQDLSGPTVILFWATWCPYCKALMPHLQSILDEYRGRHGITVLAIVFRDDGDPLSVLHDRGYEFDLFTEGDAVAESWGVKGAPGLFLADASGQVVFSRAAIREEQYPPLRGHDFEQLSNTQKASRVAPFWAGRLRLALDQMIGQVDDL